MRCDLGWVKLVGHALTGSIENSSMSELSVIVAATWNVGLRTWRAYWGQRTLDEGRSKMRRKQPLGNPQARQKAGRPARKEPPFSRLGLGRKKK